MEGYCDELGRAWFNSSSTLRQVQHTQTPHTQEYIHTYTHVHTHPQFLIYLATEFNTKWYFLVQVSGQH